MSNSSPKKFRIIVVQKENLREHDLKEVIIHCSTTNQFKTILKKNDSSNLIIACDNDTLINIAPLLEDNSNLDTLYIRTDQKDILWPTELANGNFKWGKISNEKKLMRCLYLKAMQCYFEQGEEYKKNGEGGLANLCFDDAIKALEQAKFLI